MAEHFRDEFDKFVVPPFADEFVIPPSGDDFETNRLKAELQTFASEAELLRGANRLPTLSSRLRERVVNAATSAYRQARRWAQARQAASFLSLCLLASFVLSPLANSSLTESARTRLAEISAASRDLAATDNLASAPQPHSVWTLRHDREFLGLPKDRTAQSKIENPKSKIQNPVVARSESPPPSDKLLTALRSSDGWATVQAFQAVRSRSHSTLQRAFAAN